MLQISHNPDLVSIDGLAGLQTVSNMYVSNNIRHCYVLNQLSTVQYWQVSEAFVFTSYIMGFTTFL